MLYDKRRANVLANPPPVTRAKPTKFYVAPQYWILPQGARVCQRKACLASIDHFLKWCVCVFTSVAHRVAFPLATSEKKWGCPISLGLVFCILSALATSTRCLCIEKMVWPMSPPSVLQQYWPLDQTQKMGVSHFTLLVFCMSRAGSVHAVLMHKKMGLPISPRLCFAEQFPCSCLGVNDSPPPLKTLQQWGVYSRSLWLPTLAILAVFDGARLESTCAQRKWTKVFTDAYWNLTGCHISAKICCTLYVSCESELFHDLWFSSLLIYLSYTPWFKQCCNWRNVYQTVFVLVGLVMFFNSMNLDLINGGRHFGSRFQRWLD